MQRYESLKTNHIVINNNISVTFVDLYKLYKIDSFEQLLCLVFYLYNMYTKHSFF